MEFQCANLDEMEEAAKKIAVALKQPLILMQGEMGSGKTTFVQKILPYLGSHEQVNSPTFTLVNEYHGSKGTIYHLDLYRLEDVDSFLEIGGEEYLYSSDFCFIEWPELVEPLLPEEFHHITIDVHQGVRIVNFK